jgi:hypothetical protein
MIDHYFKGGLHPAPEHISFKSGYTLRKKLLQMHSEGPRDLGKDSWKSFDVLYQSRGTKNCWLRDPLHYIEYLLAQRTFGPYLIWSPVIERDQNGEQIFYDIQTSDWWWEAQVSTHQT